MSLSRKIISAVVVSAAVLLSVSVFAADTQGTVPAKAGSAAEFVTTQAVPENATHKLDPHYQEPQNYSEAAEDVMFSIHLVKTGYWVGFALAISQLLIFAIKRIPSTSTKLKKYGTFAVIALSALAALLASVVGGLSWPAAALVFLGTSAPKFINDLLSELGFVEHKLNGDGTPAAPPAAPAEPPVAPV